MSLLAQHLARFDDVDLIAAQASSQQALEWLNQGKVHVAGSHLRDSLSGEYNLPAIKRLFPKGEVKVVTFAIWEQGFVVPSGNPKHIRGAADLARKDVCIMNREKGAGSRDLLDQKLREAGVPAGTVNGYNRLASGHLPAALAVSLNEADCCVATRSAARAFGLRVSVAPSATPLLDATALARLQEAGVEAISLSLDGSTAARHDGLRGVPGTFERTLAAARAAGAAGLPFQVNTLVAQETLDDLPAIYLLASELGAARWSLFFLVSVGRGSVLESITPAAADDLMRWLVELAEQGVGPVVTTTEAPHFRRVMLQRHGAPGRGQGAGIRDGNGIMFISHTGDVQPSGFLPLTAGNVRTQHVVEIYRESSLFRTLRRADLFEGRCGRCEFHWQCGGSRARAYAASGDPFGEDPLCSYQPRASR